MKGNKLIKNKLIEETKEKLLDLPAFQLKKKQGELFNDMIKALPFYKSKENWSKLDLFIMVFVTWQISISPKEMLLTVLYVFLLPVLVTVNNGWIPRLIIALMVVLWVVLMYIAALRWIYKFIQAISLVKARAQINTDVNSYVDSIESMAKRIPGDPSFLSSRIAKDIIKQEIYRLELSSKTINSLEILGAFSFTAILSKIWGPSLLKLAGSFLEQTRLIRDSSSLESEKLFSVLVGFLIFVIRDLINRANGLHIEKLRLSLNIMEVSESEAISRE